MDFHSRLLREGHLLEEKGLYPYVHQLVDRRWNDSTLHGCIYAIANNRSKPLTGDQICAKEIPSLGNMAYICTIILIDPGHPTLLAIMNREYLFVKHCLTVPIPKAFVDTPIAITAHQKDNTTVIAISHGQLLQPRQTLCAINIPQHVKLIVRGICKTYSVQIMSEVQENTTTGTVSHFTLLTPQTPIDSALRSIDFCPLSCTTRAIDNFDPYRPSMWVSAPRPNRGALTGSAPCLTMGRESHSVPLAETSAAPAAPDAAIAAYPNRAESAPTPKSSMLWGSPPLCAHDPDYPPM